MNALEIQNLLERVGSLIRTESRSQLHELGMQQVQLDALYYLSICNRFSDTAKAVTEYLGLTKGTVSQSLKVLENKSLIAKQADADDKRVTHLQVTHEGRALLSKLMPSEVLVSALETWTDGDEKAFGLQLHRLLQDLQQANRYRSFGLCKSCRHNLKGDTGYFCQLTQQPLTPAEIELICLEHEDA